MGKFGGKFCFKDEKGHYSTHETPCSFETTATLAQNKITHDKDKYEALVKILKAEMCKGGNGPCGENGNCKVEIDDDGKLTSWCKCTAGYKGKWCEQAPPKEKKWVKQAQGKAFGGSGCTYLNRRNNEITKVTDAACMAKCEATYGSNAVTLMSIYCWCYKCTSSTATMEARNARSYFKP